VFPLHSLLSFITHSFLICCWCFCSLLASIHFNSRFHSIPFRFIVIKVTGRWREEKQGNKDVTVRMKDNKKNKGNNNGNGLWRKHALLFTLLFLFLHSSWNLSSGSVLCCVVWRKGRRASFSSFTPLPFPSSQHTTQPWHLRYSWYRH